MSVGFSASYYNVKNSNHISQYRFTNTKQSLYYNEQSLPFYTLSDYQFTLNNYLFVNSKFYLFNLPEVLNFRTSLTCFVSYLNSFTTPRHAIQEVLEKDLFEYGIGIDGVSFFNFYLVKNNLDSKNIYFKSEFSF